MNTEDLKATHQEYKNNLDEWLLYQAAYGGTKKLVDWGALDQNKREELKEFTRRQKNAYGFNFTAKLVGILNSYIFQKPHSNNYGSIGDDPLFQMFLEDADLSGSSFDSVINDRQEKASVFGHIGFLVNKPPLTGIQTASDEIKKKIYPYICSYTPINILDWEFTRVNGRQELTYIKLLDDDGFYNIWWTDKWEIWKVKDDEALLEDEGINTLGVIPFVFMVNGDRCNKCIGKSDVIEASRMDIAILRLISSTQEIFDLAAFPMLRKPQLRNSQKDDDAVSSGSIMEFDPNHPDSKPDWLKAEVAEPIKAISDWLDKLKSAIYDSVNAGHLNTSGQAESGESKKRAFATLNAELAKKVTLSLEPAMYSILWFWLLWQGKTDKFSEISISLPTDFDIQSLTDDLDNISAARMIVDSDTFDRETQKSVARKTLPNVTQELEQTINGEIDANTAANRKDADERDRANRDLTQ